jgi:hypothetical protein
MADNQKTLNIVLSATDKLTQAINSATQNAVAKLGSVQKTTNQMANSAFAMGQSMGIMGIAMGAPLVSFVKEAEDAQAEARRLEQVFKSMGETSGVAANHAKALAASMEMDIAVDGGQITDAMAKLATFEKVIKNNSGSMEVFDRATKAAFDMQAAGFGDANGNVVQLGKALQDPIKGITALNKSGITFNATEQQKIKSLVASGKQFEAQQLILAAVEKQVGGVAKASAKDSDRMLLAFKQVKEELGAALLPTLASLTGWLTGTAIPAFQSFMEKNGETVAIVLKVTAGIAALSLGISALSFVFGGVMKIISVAAGTMKLLATGIGLVSRAVLFLNTTFLGNPIVLAIMAIIAVGILLYRNWETVKTVMLAAWEGIKAGFQAAANYLGGVITWIIGQFQALINWFGSIGTMFYNAGSNIATSIWEGIKAGWTYITDGMGNLVQGIRNYLPFSPAKEGPLKDLHKIKFVETMMMGFNPQPALNAMSGMAGAMAGTVSAGSVGASTPATVGASAGGGGGSGMVLNYSPNVSIAGGTEQDRQSFMSMLNEHKVQILKMLESEQQKQNRKKY